MCVHAHVCMCKCVLTPLSWVTRTKHGAEWGESSSPHSVPAALQSFCTYWMFLTRSYFLPHSTRPLWPAFLLLASIPCSFQHSSFWLLQLSILLPRIWKRSLQPLEDPWHLSQVCAADSNNDLRILIFFFPSNHVGLWSTFPMSVLQGTVSNVYLCQPVLSLLCFL